MPFQILWQHAIFDRAEEGRGGARQEQHNEVHDGVFEPQAQGAEYHGGEIEELDPPRQNGLVVFVRQLARDGREQEIGQHEQRHTGLHE